MQILKLVTPVDRSLTQNVFVKVQHQLPKGTNTEWNSEPLKNLEKLRVLLEIGPTTSKKIEMTYLMIEY